MLSLIQIQTVWYTDGIPEIVFENINFEYNISRRQKTSQIIMHAKS